MDINMELITKEKAKENGLKFYFTGKPCKRGVVAPRRVSTNNCTCERCRKVKNKGNSDWYKSVKHDDKWQEKQSKYRQSNAERKREYDKMYRARTADKQKAWNDAWAAANPDKVKAIKQNYKARRRKWESSGISSKELGEWCKNQVKKCYWCGSNCKEEYHIDHYEPLAKGGKHCTSNMVISCPKCNMKKKAKDPYDWAQEIGRLF